MRTLFRLHRFVGLLVAAAGLVALIGWWLGLGVDVSSVAYTAPTLKPDTALGFLFLGMALVALDGGELGRPIGRLEMAGLGAALAAGLLGVLVLLEYVAGVNLGVDQFLLPQAFHNASAVGWGRMSPATALEFVVTGLASALMMRNRLVRLAQLCLVAALMFALLPLVADAYHGLHGWVRIGVYRGMATPTAALFVMGTFAALAARPRSGILQSVSGTGMGAKSFRYLFPILVVTLLIIGGLRVVGERAGYFSGALGTAGLMVAVIAAIGIVLWRHAGQLNQLEIERDRFFLTATDLLCIADFDGRFLRVNPAFTEVLGWSSEELVAQQFFGFVHPDDLAATHAVADQIAGGERTLRFENRYRCKDGSWRWLSWASTPVVAERRMYASARDVTELRASQEELARSEQHLSVTLDSIGDGVITTDASGVVTRLNPVAERMTGWTMAEACGQPIGDVFRIVNEETRQPAVIPVPEVLRTGRIQGLANHTVLIARDGTECPISDSAAPIRDPATGDVLGVVLVFHDDTSERAAARAMRRMNETLEEEVRERTETLQQAEQLFESLFAFAPDATILTDAHGIIVRANRQVEQLFGWTESELIGQAVELLMPEAVRGRHVGHRDGYARQPIARQTVGDPGGLVASRRDGSTFPVAISLSPIESPEGMLMAASVRDLTGQLHLEERLRQSQKMEAIGLLAGGVAHDFNNLLTIINGYTDLLEVTLPVESPFRTEVAAIRDAGQRAMALTGQLLTFSRQQVLEPVALNPDQVITEMATMLQRLVGDDVTLHTTIRDQGMIRVDPNRLGESVMNLVVNGRDAMPGGGHLTIETAVVTFDGEYVLAHPDLQAGSWFMVAVSDSGEGMDDETRARAFDPFFTTKARGKGTGMGLAMVHGFVKQSGGHLAIYSELDRGTTIRMYFPQIDAVETGERPVSRAADAPPTGVETILLIEDEDAVRTMARRTLEHLGYRVIEAESGAVGLELAREHPEPIHLLLTDLMMPGLGGVEVADRMRAFRPEVRIVFMSGYTSDVAVRHGVFDATLDFVQKPFTTRRLATKIREVLDR